MKRIILFSCLAVAGVAIASTAYLTSAKPTMSADCCAAVTPMADTGKSDTKAKPYPLTTCIVSGEKLGEMGDPYVFTHEGQEIKLCCKDCKKKFDKDSATYLKKLKEASAKK